MKVHNHNLKKLSENDGEWGISHLYVYIYIHYDIYIYLIYTTYIHILAISESRNPKGNTRLERWTTNISGINKQLAGSKMDRE